MNRKNKIIVSLLVIATVLFCIIQFVMIPTSHAKQVSYANKQTDALTHDITSIVEFKSPYIGDAINVISLFSSLPLGDVPKKFEINSDTCALTVDYLDTVWDIGEDKVQRDLIYNSVAAMATIDNLSEITYHFSGESYSFNRKQMEEVFGSPLKDLLEPKIWQKEVQDKLNAMDFVAQFFSTQSK